MGHGIWGLEFRVSGVGFGVWGVGCGVWGLGCGVLGVGCGVWGVRCGVWGVGCWIWGSGLGFRVDQPPMSNGLYEIDLNLYHDPVIAFDFCQISYLKSHPCHSTCSHLHFQNGLFTALGDLNVHYDRVLTINLSTF